MSDRLEEILTEAGVPKGFHKIIGMNKLSNIDTFTEAKQALQSYIDTKIIDELKGLLKLAELDKDTASDWRPPIVKRIAELKALNNRKDD